MQAPQPFQIDDFFDRIRAAAQRARFQVEPYGVVAGQPLLALTRKAQDTAYRLLPEPRARILISTGMHGDEPAGPLALLRLLSERWFAPDIEWWLFPAMNPEGLRLGTRENARGLDLNRDFFNFAEYESRQYRDFLFRDDRRPIMDLTLLLHEDWEAEGFYCYELKRKEDHPPDLKAAILSAAVSVMPLDPRETIDDRVASGGWISPLDTEALDPTDPEQVPGAEAIWLYNAGISPLNFTLETPSSGYIADRIRTHCRVIQAAVGAVLDAKSSP